MKLDIYISNFPLQEKVIASNFHLIIGIVARKFFFLVLRNNFVRIIWGPFCFLFFLEKVPGSYRSIFIILCIIYSGLVSSIV